MKIAMVASEALPFCKTGGLADVAYSLSKELAVMGEEVYIIMPFYKQIKDKHNPDTKLVSSFPIQMSWRANTANVYVTYVSGITYYLIECDQYFARGGLYGEMDDMERFAFFTLATRELFYRLNLKPDIIHIHDWHPGMLAALIREDNYAREYFKNTKLCLSIHNSAFQGLIDRYFLANFYGLSDELYDSGKVRFNGMVSTLKAAIMYCDKIITVSPNNRGELLSVEGGMGLDSVLQFRRDDFLGILNGIDYLEFDPAKDEVIPFNFNAVNFFKVKAQDKAALFDELHIKDFGQPCFSIVSRLTWQKGLDLCLPTFEELARRGCNIIVLGSGEYRYEQQLEQLRAKYPENVAIYIGYNDALAHKIYASSDFFLMPSLFEPCGLGQMIAQRYGTLPIVRYVGGLKDSVIGYDNTNLESANGFGFYDYTIDALKNTCIYALGVYHDVVTRKQLMKNALKTNNSWKKSAKEYLLVYKNLLNK